MQALLSVFYIPCSGDEEAKNIAQKLLAERLIACANIFPGVQSLYVWEGQLQSSTEAVLIIKSAPEQNAALTLRLQELHSYDCPCFLELEPRSINGPFAAWVRSSVLGTSLSAKSPIVPQAPRAPDDDRPPWD